MSMMWQSMAKIVPKESINMPEFLKTGLAKMRTHSSLSFYILAIKNNKI